LYEPGSTFKTITAMVLIDNNKCDTSYIVPTGVKRFNPKNKHSEIHDVRDYSHGNISMKRSFEVSSNVGTCQPVWDFYNDNRKEFANSIKKIMPYKRLNIDLTVGGEPTPHLESDLNPDRNFLNLAYGYSSNITALQLLTFYNAIANNGTMVKPIFCSEIKEGEKTIKTIRPEVINEEICSARTLKIIQSMLEGVVENGSARRLSKTPYGIAGKTGTSQINYTQKDKNWYDGPLQGGAE
jgi:cell division protein FtsI (penicillin-binding protein 3)